MTDINKINAAAARRMMENRIDKENKLWEQAGVLPSREAINQLIQYIRQLVFSSVYAPQHEPVIESFYQMMLQSVSCQTRALIEAGLRAQTREEADEAAPAGAMTAQFIEKLPEIQELLYSDVEAVSHNDPAATSRIEIVTCYPAITVMLHYRVAHALYEIGVPLVPRMMTELAHSTTGVDIHPAAKIGASFGIDHGTGIVIGETAVIGNEVMIYQGVTLGAKNFHRSDEGDLLNLPRHPIIEDRVTIYSNTSVLGRIRIGHDSIIGGNLWITKDIAPNSHLRQSKPVKFPGFIDGAGI